MKTYLRILSYLKPFRVELGLSMILTLLFAVFSSFSILTVSPLFKVIFYPDQVVETPAAESESASESGTELAQGILQSKDQLKDRMIAFVEDVIIQDTREETLLVLCLTILVIFVLKNLVYFLSNFFLATIINGVTRNLRNELFSHLTHLSLDYFDRSNTGTLMSRVTNDVTVINRAITNSFIGLLREPLLAIIFLSMIFIISVKLTLVAFGVSFGTLFIIRGISRSIRKYSGRSQEWMAQLSSKLQEVISGIRVVKAFTAEETESERFAHQGQQHFRAMRRLELSGKMIGPINEVFGVMGLVVVLWVGGAEVLSGTGLSADEFLLFLFALYSVMSPVKNLSKVHAGIQEGVAAADRVFHVLDEVPTVTSGKGTPSAPKQGLRFEKVSFRYDEEFVLHDIDLEVKCGEVVALVGPSGGGKSTLADLLVRFYDPTSGRVTLDGTDIRDFEIKSYRDLLGVVTQETILFNDTVRANVAYGMAPPSDEDLIAAARAANAHDFITQLPDGYDTVIGDRGVRLSGGQRQRLQIARALLHNPPILVLDEATSALDTTSEALVQEALSRLMKDRTSIVIAHRLSTVRDADRIVVLDQGRIVEEGRHEDLLTRQGMYSRLSRLQYDHEDMVEVSQES